MVYLYISNVLVLENNRNVFSRRREKKPTDARRHFSQRQRGHTHVGGARVGSYLVLWPLSDGGGLM